MHQRCINKHVLTRKTYILLLLIAGFNLQLISQTDQCHFSISGKVEDHLGQPVQFMTILLKETYSGTITNIEGYFELPSICVGKYVLIGKKFDQILIKDTITISETITKNYLIHSDILNLNSIEVNDLAKQTSTSVRQQLSKDQIVKTEGLPLGTMLEELNGVRSLKTGQSVAKPVIHGLHSNRILILNNGIRQEGQRWGVEHAPEIDPFVTNNISLVKGADALKYGFDAIGGVVIIAPEKNKIEKGINGNLSLIGSSNGRQGVLSTFLSGHHAKWQPFYWKLQGSLKRGGNIHTPNYYLKNTGLKEYNFSGHLNWIKKRYGIQLYYSQFNTDLGIFSGSHIGNLTDLQQAFLADQPSETANFSYAIDRPWQHITHELVKASVYIRTGNLGKLSLTYGRQYNLRFEYDKHQSLNDSIAELNTPDLELELTTHSANLGWKHYRIKGFEGEIGLTGIFQKNTYSGRKFIPNFTNMGTGIYWVEKKKIKKMIIEGSIRYDFRFLQAFMWENNTIISPKHNYQNLALNMGIAYHISKAILLKFNISKTWRPPAINELYSDGLHHGAASVEIGKSSLSEEKSINTNLELTYQSKTLKISINPYINYFSNYIYLAPKLPPTLTIKGAFPTFHFNEAKVYITGIDLDMEIKLTDHIKNKFRGSILKGFNKTDQTYLIQMPANFFQNEFKIQLHNLGFLNTNTINLKYKHVFEQKNVPKNSDYIVPPEAYNLFDLAFATKISIKQNKVSIHFEVNNILNTSYRDYLNRFRYYTDEIGRNFTLRLKIPLNTK